MAARFTLPAIALAGLLAAVTPATAAPLVVAGPNGVRTVEDPALPPRAESDLPRPPASRAERGSARPAASRRGPSVRRALRRLMLDGKITREDHDRFREIYEEARRVRGRLSGGRRAELHQVIRVLERIAADESLTTRRLEPLFLIVQRNTEWWRAKPFPAGGTRITFRGDPVIFQYYRGHGLQIQPLANFGKANALYNACTGENTRPGTPCRRGALRDLVDRLVELSARRGTFTTWEYYFHFGGGSPPWTSGLSQGTAVQALSRAAELLADPNYLTVATDALGAFERRAPTGVRQPAEGGNHYLLYSFDRRLRVLNGFLQAVIGLHDLAKATGDPRAQSLFEAGEAAARLEVPRHDTGAWSLYSLGGRESDLGYHRLVRDFLRGLCTRLGTPLYCETTDRFTRYLLEHPKLRILRLRRTRAGRVVRIRYRLSKRSRVSIHVSRRGKVAYHRKLNDVGYGTRAFGWRPKKPGLYRVRIEVADLRNHHTVRRARIRVLRPRR